MNFKLNHNSRSIPSIAYLIIFLVLFINLINVKGQVIDKKSIAILDEVSNKTKSYKVIKIDFSYKMENTKDKINESKSGTIIVSGDKYNLDISGQNVICDSKTIWTYIKDADEVHINNVNPDNDNININKILTDYNKDFRSKLIKQEKQEGIDVYVIDLTPIKGKSYHRVRLTIDVNKKQIVKAAIYDKNGTNYSYIVTKFSTNINMNNTKFTFNKSDHPKAEIIDMR